MTRWPAAMLVSTAAEYLDTSEKTVRALINAGHVGAIQFNPRGDIRILRTELDFYLERLRDQRVTSPKSEAA